MPITLTRPQARAILALLRHAELPGLLDRHDRKALTHARVRLRAQLDRGVLHRLVLDLDRLEDVLLGVRSAALRDLIHGRARDLLTTVLLWSAAEELPADVRAGVLDVEKVGEGSWRADVLDLLDTYGLRVSLPGDGVVEEDVEQEDN